MGGGGARSWFGKSGPDKLSQQLRKEEESTKNTAFDIAVSNFLASTLAEYNDRDTEAVHQILEKVKLELLGEFEREIELRFGGSVSKNTYVNGLSDVDALVLLDVPGVENMSPEDLRSIFAERLRSRFGRGAVHEGRLAVTLEIEGHCIQLLPAIRDGEHFKISSSDGVGWSTIRPRVFAERLTRANRDMDGKLVPTVKLVKGIIGALPEQRQLSGYHMEVLAVEIFKGYIGAKVPKEMLRYFFDNASALIKRPLVDLTGQSVYLDSYLDERGPMSRQIVADAIERISRRIRNADGAQSIERWRELIGVHGP